jgi:hypothetical protein
MRPIHWFVIPSFRAANSQLSVHRWNSEAVEAGGARHLRAELFRMTGTELTQIDGINVTTTMTILSEAAWDIKLVWVRPDPLTFVSQSRRSSSQQWVRPHLIIPG